MMKFVVSSVVQWFAPLKGAYNRKVMDNILATGEWG